MVTNGVFGVHVHQESILTGRFYLHGEVTPVKGKVSMCEILIIGDRGGHRGHIRGDIRIHIIGDMRGHIKGHI